MLAHNVVHNYYVNGFHELDLDGKYTVKSGKHAFRVRLEEVVVLFEKSLASQQVKLFILQGLDHELLVFCEEEETCRLPRALLKISHSF